MIKSKLARVLLIGWLICLGILHIYQDPPVGSIEGYVFDKAKSIPIEGAKVSSHGKTYKSVKTKANGYFKLSGLVEGNYSVKAVRKGYLASWKYGNKVKEKGEIPSVNFTLREALPRFYMYSSKKTFRPGDKKFLGLRGYNVDKAYFTVYKVDMEGYVKKVGSSRNLKKISLDDVKYVTKWDVDLTKEEEWIYKDTEIPVKDPGVYLIKAWAKNPKNLKLEDTLWINVTNLGLITKQSRSKLLVWALDFKNNKPSYGTEIQVYNNNEQETEGTTNHRGLFTKQYDLNNNFIFAKYGNSVAFNYSSQVYYSTYGHKAYIYTERPVYRPKQTVYFKGIVRGIGKNNEYRLKPNQLVEVKVYDPKDNIVWEKDLRTNGWGSVNDHFSLDEEPPLGEYSIVFSINDEEYYGRFKVEEYRKPEFKVEIKSDKEAYIAGDALKATIAATYYFGQPVSGAKVKYTIFSSRYYFWDYEEDYYDYYSDEGYYEEEYGYGYGRLVQEGEVKTNSQGIIEISIPTEKLGENRKYFIEAQVTDESERTVSKAESVIVMAGEFDIFLESKGYVKEINSTINVTVKSNDINKKPVKADIEIDLIRYGSKMRDGKWVSLEKKIFSKKVKTKSDGTQELFFKVNKGGDYYVRAKAKDKHGNIIERQLWFWVVDEKEAIYSKREELKIQIDQTKYVPGQKAKVLITSTEPNSFVLFTVEGGDLYQSKVLYLKGNSKVIDLPIRESYVPGIFLVTSYVSKECRFIREQKKVKVSQESKEIIVKIKPNKEKYLPNERATFIIQTKNNRGKATAAEVSLSIVDEAIYAIQPEMVKKIIDKFYGRARNMVSTSYSFGSGYIGGITKFESAEIRRKFKDTAFWRANVYTNKNGIARVSFNFPENLTTWRATARAHTKNNLFGSVTDKVVVSKPLVARLELPRFFRVRDNLEVTTIIHNYSKKTQNIKVKLKLKGVTFGDNKSYKEKSINLKEKASKKLIWKLAIKNIGTAKITMWAGNKNISDGMELKVPILAHGIKKIDYLSGSIVDLNDAIKKTKTLGLSISQHADMKTVDCILRISPTVASSLFSALDYLVDYPYGCVEQTMSRVLPNVFVFKTLKELGVKNATLEKKLPKYIKKGVKRLISLQHDDGGWGWWKHDSTQPFMTAYALYGLLISKNVGGKVPSRVLRKGLKALEKEINKLNDELQKTNGYRKKDLLKEKAYMLYVLTNFRKVTPKEVNGLYELRNELTPKTLALLAITLKRAGLSNRARQIMDLLKSKAIVKDRYCYWKEMENGYYSDNQNIEATAYVLIALINLDSKNTNIDKVTSWLMSKRNGDHWVSTKTTSVIVQAFIDYVKNKVKRAAPNYKANVWINNNYITTIEIDEKNIFSKEKEIKINRKYFGVGENSLKIEKIGKGELYYSLNLEYFGKEEDIRAKYAKDLSIKREFYKKVIKEDPESEEIVFDYQRLGSNIKLGDLIEVRLTITNKNFLRYLVIEDPLLCGGEVFKHKRGSEWRYWFANREVRDEKVALFISRLKPGKHILEYEIRPELIGAFHVMPAVLYAMYEPSIYVYTKEDRFEVK